MTDRRFIDPNFRHPRRPNGPTTSDRFWKYIDKNGPLSAECGTPCWVWTGSRSAGYGQMGVKLDGRNVPLRASIVSWALAHGGELPPLGMFVCHRCDNRACARVDHLFLGTPKDNARDAQMKGRYRRTFSPKPPRIPKRKPKPSSPIQRWLATAGFNESQLAGALGVTRQAVNLWTLGRGLPSAETAAQLEELSFGAVPASSWIKTLVPRRGAADEAGPDVLATRERIASLQREIRALKASIRYRRAPPAQTSAEVA